MYYNFDTNLNYFNRFLEGHLSLDEILNNEKPYLYDYIFRMCGQLQIAEKLLEESINAVKIQHSKITSLKDLRMLLFATARSFGADVWNANTSQLQNAGFKILSQDSESIDLFILSFVEKQLNVLSPLEKEILILEYKYAFNIEEICHIIRLPLNNVLECKNNSFKTFENKLKLSTDEIIKIIQHIPLHPLEEKSILATKAFSEILQDVKINQQSKKFNITYIFILILIILIIIFFVLQNLNFV